MLLLYANNIDVTENLWKDTLKITEQLNNRVNTCSFRMDQLKISEGQSIEFFEYLSLTSQTNSWTAILNYDQDFEFSDKFRSGDEILINIKESDQIIVTIDSINHTAKTITLTANVAANVLKWAKIWRKIFWGTTMKNPEEEIWCSGTFSYRVSVSDYSEAINRENVVDTFEDQYIREIVSRIVYRFTSEDFNEDLDLFESAWVHSWTARPMSDEWTDKIQWNYSQSTGILWVWVAKWTKTITSVDISSADHFKQWFKIGAWEGSKISDFKFRIWQNSSNYYEMSSSWVWSENEGTWWMFSFMLNRSTETWIPNLTAVTWIELEMTSIATVSLWSILFDHLFAVWNWFTLNNVKRGFSKFSDIRSQYKKLTVLLEDLAKLQGDFWYIDYSKDIHLFSNTGNTAPFSLDDSSENFGQLKISADISKLKNRQTVRGWQAPSEALYVQESIVDWVEESWRLDYPPKTLRIYTDTGAGYIKKTVWIENLVNETSVDYVYNFNEKTVRRWNAALLSLGDKIKLEYFPYKDIRVQIKNNVSVATMKAIVWGNWIFDWAVISDNKIKTFSDARVRAKAELDVYSNAILTATFQTNKDWLSAGQVIHIIDTARGIDQDFLIQKITRQSKSWDFFSYSISAWSTMFWLIEFFQLLLKRSEAWLIDVSEIVDVVTTVDEVLVISDNATLTAKSKIVTAWDLQLNHWDFIYQTWTVTSSWRIWPTDNFSNFYWEFIWWETWSILFDTWSNYNDTKALKIETQVWGTWKSIEARTIFRIPIKSSTQYKLKVFLEILSDFTNQWASPGVFITWSEFNAKTGWASLAITTIVNWEKTFQDFNKYEETFTTNASSNYLHLSFKITDSIWIASISDIILEEQWVDSESNPWIADFSEVT